ncbi:hypothetical protein GCM10027404_12830 [Arthrobacter tumbae]
MVTDVTEAPLEVPEKTRTPVELEERLITVPPAGAETGLPNESWRCTVNGPRFAVPDAVPETGEVV